MLVDQEQQTSQNGRTRTIRCGVDIGGTFTDCTIGVDGQVALGKALSSYEDGFLTGCFSSMEAAADRLGLTLDDVLGGGGDLICHASTVATNVVVQRNGARVAAVVTRGFEDTLALMRGVGRWTGIPAEEIFQHTSLRKPSPLVPPERIEGVVERMDSDGDVVVELDERAVAESLERLRDDGVESLAVCLLWSVRNAEHERRVGEIAREVMGPDVHVTLSSQVSSFVGEYERFLATVINAYVAPSMTSYLRGLEAALQERGFAGDILFMNCNGGVVPLGEALSLPIMSIGSGPVGGLVGCAELGPSFEDGVNFVAADMGGTSFDAGLVVAGRPLGADSTLVDQFRYEVTSVEVFSIGAGGGSIAWFDPHSQALRIGPRSAGSRPGPACYGGGGTEPTVTDADLVLGYIDPQSTFGQGSGAFQPSLSLAAAAIGDLADVIGLDAQETAFGIVEIASAQMSSLLENSLTGRGFDPRDFYVVAYGSAGPVHAAFFTDGLPIKGVIIPTELASVWSAHGCANAPLKLLEEKSVVMVEPLPLGELAEAWSELEGKVSRSLQNMPAHESVAMRRYARLRYKGQMHDLDVELPGGPVDAEWAAELSRRFVTEYRSRYSDAALLPGMLIEIVSLRVEGVMQFPTPRRHVAVPEGGEPRPSGTRQVRFVRSQSTETPVYAGDRVGVGQTVHGPAVIDMSVTGIVVPEGRQVARHPSGNFVMNRS